MYTYVQTYVFITHSHIYAHIDTHFHTYVTILAGAIEILRKRIAAGTATFLVKVKAHRGESANEGAEIQVLADKAISDPKVMVGKERCQQTNRAVFTWRKPCREAGKRLSFDIQ